MFEFLEAHRGELEAKFTGDWRGPFLTDDEVAADPSAAEARAIAAYCIRQLCAAAQVDPATFRIAIAGSDCVRAKAIRLNDGSLYLIIPAGAFTTLQSMIARLIMPQEGRRPLADLGLPLVAANLDGEVRRNSHRRASVAIGLLALHECIHLINGHLAVAPNPVEDDSDRLTLMTLEFDADAGAAQHALNSLISIRVTNLPDHLARAEAWEVVRDIIFAAEVVFLNSTTPWTIAGERLHRGTHPPPLHRIITYRSTLVAVIERWPALDRLLGATLPAINTYSIEVMAAIAARVDHADLGYQGLDSPEFQALTAAISRRWAAIRDRLTNAKIAAYNLAPAGDYPA